MLPLLEATLDAFGRARPAPSQHAEAAVPPRDSGSGYTSAMASQVPTLPRVNPFE